MKNVEEGWRRFEKIRESSRKLEKVRGSSRKLENIPESLSKVDLEIETLNLHNSALVPPPETLDPSLGSSLQDACGCWRWAWRPAFPTIPLVVACLLRRRDPARVSPSCRHLVVDRVVEAVQFVDRLARESGKKHMFQYTFKPS